MEVLQYFCSVLFFIEESCARGSEVENHSPQKPKFNFAEERDMKSQSKWSQFWNRYGIASVCMVVLLIGILVVSAFPPQQSSNKGSLDDNVTPQPEQDYRCDQNKYTYPFAQKLSIAKGTFLVMPGGQSCFDIDGQQDGSVFPFDSSTKTLLVPDRSVTGVFSTNDHSITPLTFNTAEDYCRWERNGSQFSRQEENWIFPNEVTDYIFYQHGTFDWSYKYDDKGLSARATALSNLCAKLFPAPKFPQKVFCGGIVEYVGVDIPRATPDWANYYELDDQGDPYALVLTRLTGAAFLCVTDANGSLLFMKYYFPGPNTLVLHAFKDYHVQIWMWNGAPEGYVVPWKWFNDCSYVREQHFGSFQTILPRTDGDGVDGDVHNC
jgi:hypothetical protein